MRFAADHVGIIVSDVERSKAFYAALGFELDSEYDDGTKTLVFLKGENLRLELFCYRDTPPVSPAAGQRVLGFRHLAFRVDDIDEAVARLTEAGLLQPGTAVRDVPGPGSAGVPERPRRCGDRDHAGSRRRMRIVREAFSFVVWLVIGWAWLMVVSLFVGGIVAFSIEWMFVTPSSPPVTNYLLSGLALFAAALISLFTTSRTGRFGRGVLAAVFLVGIVDVASALLTRFGVDVGRFGLNFVIAGTSIGVGAQLVNGVALLVGGALFVFVRNLDRAQSTSAEAAGADEADEAAGERTGEPHAESGDEPPGSPEESDEFGDHPSSADAGAEESVTSYTI